MAKREFIDVEQVITEIKNMDNNGCITRAVNHVCEDIRMIPTVSEQEIVKPYLNKIRAEIEEIETYDGLYIDRAYVLQIIGKYKAESE